MSNICSSSIRTLGDLLSLLEKAHPADSFQSPLFITDEGYLILTTYGRNTRPQNEESNTFEGIISDTRDYIEKFGNDHPLKICHVNYDRDNIYIDVTRTYIDELCHHIELYIDDHYNEVEIKIQNLIDSSYDTLSDILILLKKVSMYDKYAKIENGIRFPEDCPDIVEDRFYFDTAPVYLCDMIQDIERVINAYDNLGDGYFDFRTKFTENSPFLIQNDLSGEKKNLLIEELCEIIEEGMNKDYAERFEPEPYVTLDRLRDLLSNATNAYCEYGFRNPHSYREDYDEVGFEPASHVTVAEMLSCVERALSDNFTGYHGGDFSFSGSTRAHISNEGCGEIPQMMQKVMNSIRNASY